MNIEKINQLLGSNQLDRGAQARINECIKVLIEDPKHPNAMSTIIHETGAYRLDSETQNVIKENLTTIIDMVAKELTENDKINLMYGKRVNEDIAISTFQNTLAKITKEQFRFDKGMGSAPMAPESKTPVDKKQFKWSKSDNAAISPLSGKNYGGSKC